jgi:hypothetical protein
MPSVLLDANLLLLLVVGATDRSYIKRHKRLKAYTESDFDALQEIIQTMTGIVVTPNILTEVSNLAKQIAEPARAEIALTFRALVHGLEESYVPSKQAAVQPEFTRLWLTDAGILEELTDGHVLLTADLGLYLAALNRGKVAENFNYRRQL